MWPFKRKARLQGDSRGFSVSCDTGDSFDAADYVKRVRPGWFVGEWKLHLTMTPFRGCYHGWMEYGISPRREGEGSNP